MHTVSDRETNQTKEKYYMFIVVGPLIMLYLPKLPKSMLPESEEWSQPAIWWGYAAVLVASQSYYGMRVLKLRPKTRLSVFQNHFYALSFQWRSLLYIWPGCWKQSADGQAIDNIPIAIWLEVCTNHWELLRSSTYWNLNFKFCKYACQLLSIQTDVLKKKPPQASVMHLYKVTTIASMVLLSKLQLGCKSMEHLVVAPRH